jgi:hypothetical protein
MNHCQIELSPAANPGSRIVLVPHVEHAVAGRFRARSSILTSRAEVPLFFTVPCTTMSTKTPGIADGRFGTKE